MYIMYILPKRLPILMYQTVNRLKHVSVAQKRLVVGKSLDT